MRASKTNIVLAGFFLVLCAGCGPKDSDREASDWRGEGGVPKPRISPKTHVAAGRLLERQGDLVAATQQYRKALAFDPGMIEAYQRLGVAYQKLDNYPEAEHFFRRGIHANPDSAVLHNNLGFCYLQQGDHAAAEGAFRAALDKSPRFDTARMNLAIALAHALRLEESAIEFSRVVPAEVAYYNVAVICCEMGEDAHAESVLRDALAANPDYAPAKRQLETLARRPRNVAIQSPAIASGPQQDTKAEGAELEVASAPMRMVPVTASMPVAETTGDTLVRSD